MVKLNELQNKIELNKYLQDKLTFFKLNQQQFRQQIFHKCNIFQMALKKIFVFEKLSINQIGKKMPTIYHYFEIFN